MQPLKLSFLGSFKVEFQGAELTESLRTKKELAILAYLAEESARPHSRETIAEFFWPDRPETYARMNLRQALLGIRKAFGGEAPLSQFLQVTENAIQFEPRSVWMDTHAFMEHIQATKTHPHALLHTCSECVTHLEQAVECYRGNYLEGLILGDVTGFQEWIIFHRERYFHSMLDVLKSLSKVFAKQANYDIAYKYAWRYVNLAPLEESAHRMLMRILTLSGRRNAALQQYQLCAQVIERELGIAPSPETRQLYEQIKSGLPIEKIDTGSLSAAASASPTRPVQRRTYATGPLYNAVTRIPMRPLFMDRLQHAMNRMERAQLMVAVCILAVSYPLNPDMSAELKKQVELHLVRRLLGTIREGDTVAHLQENEFGIILEEIKDPLVLSPIAQKIIKAAGSPIQVQGQRIEVRLAFGSSLYPADGADPITLLNQAEVAMRTARMQQANFYIPPSS